MSLNCFRKVALPNCSCDPINIVVGLRGWNETTGRKCEKREGDCTEKRLRETRDTRTRLATFGLAFVNHFITLFRSNYTHQLQTIKGP
jgi:hypothetical protein